MDGKINSELLYMAHTDVSLARKIHWANSPDEISSSYLNKMATVVGIGDGFVSQLVEDGLEIIDGVLALNPFDSRLYNETIPAIFELGKAIVDKKITIKAIGEAVGQTLANEFVKPFENVSNNYQYILDGHGKYSENQQFGRDLAKVVELLTVVGGTVKGAQLMTRLGPQLRELFERIGSKESKQVKEKLEHNEELENGERAEGRGETGTVWDDIKATQPNNPGTSIPKSFELTVNGERYWVNPNATKHMVEYSTRTTSHGQKLTEQQLLSSFQSAVKEAAEKGYKFNEPVVVGNWELIFSPSREVGQLPVIKHALYIP